MHIPTKQSQVMRDITSDAACGTVNRTWMRGCLRVTDSRPVAYTHLDVYKRQGLHSNYWLGEY